MSILKLAFKRKTKLRHLSAKKIIINKQRSTHWQEALSRRRNFPKVLWQLYSPLPDGSQVANCGAAAECDWARLCDLIRLQQFASLHTATPPPADRGCVLLATTLGAALGSQTWNSAQIIEARQFNNIIFNEYICINYGERLKILILRDFKT